MNKLKISLSALLFLSVAYGCDQNTNSNESTEAAKTEMEEATEEVQNIDVDATV